MTVAFSNYPRTVHSPPDTQLVPPAATPVDEPVATVAEHRRARSVPPRRQNTDMGRENRAVDLARIAWLITVAVALVTSLLLLLAGYTGYAGVALAVGVSAAINLL